MGERIQVNRSNKHAKIEARDKELLIEKIKTLHAQGYSQVEVSKILGISRNTLRRWNDELNFVSLLSPGESGKRMALKLYHSTTGTLSLKRKEEVFKSF
jgi:transposase